MARKEACHGASSTLVALCTQSTTLRERGQGGTAPGDRRKAAAGYRSRGLRGRQSASHGDRPRGPLRRLARHGTSGRRRGPDRRGAPRIPAGPSPRAPDEPRQSELAELHDFARWARAMGREQPVLHTLISRRDLCTMARRWSASARPMRTVPSCPLTKRFRCTSACTHPFRANRPTRWRREVWAPCPSVTFSRCRERQGAVRSALWATVRPPPDRIEGRVPDAQFKTFRCRGIYSLT